MSAAWDVIVCGLGGAGACAAIEAHDRGARVLVLERFEGGGATAKSGGVIYAGGGTRVQREAGVLDSVEAMQAYLRVETDGAVEEEELAAFCAESARQIEWLEGLGLEFQPRVYEPKTTQPPAGYGLYYSGNERQYAAEAGAAPAPRGHVPKARGMAGGVIFEALDRAVRARGIEVIYRAQPVELVREGEAVTGVVALELPRSPLLRRAHEALARAALASEGAREALAAFERRVGRRRVLRARGGLVLATGGFVFSPEMMRRHAPEYAGCMPLGTPGDDGRGIALGEGAGGATRHMDRCAASRFFAPPEAFTKGVLVDARGERIADESLYGATLSSEIAARGGKAFLVLDRALVEEAMAELEREERVFGRPLGEVLSGEVNHLIFRKYCAWMNAHVNRHRADSLAALERACGMPPGALERTVDEYRRGAAAGADAMGKSAALLSPLMAPPYFAVRCDLDSRAFPAPCITLGGLRVDARSGAVERAPGEAIDGLYAAGRAAAGVASRSYVSGLSLADCVHSGRRAGRAAAEAPRVLG